MTERQPRYEAIDRNARLAFGVVGVSAEARGRRLGSVRRHPQG
jgi:hypothetical protein